MDVQGQALLDFSPGYRKGQKTSQQADTEANAQFKARHTQLVYMAVRDFCNGGTAREITKAGQDEKNIKKIEEATGCENFKITHKMVWRRLHDLRDHEYLRNGERRKCKISKRLCKTWWIT